MSAKIQRYDEHPLGGITAHGAGGRFVTYSDHLAAVADLVERNKRLEAALKSLLDTHDEDVDMDEFDDSDSVGSQEIDGKITDLPLTFGILRKARAALAGEKEART
jgi:hypothetical protein